MELLALGVNHQTAALEMRERVAFTSESLPRALADLRGQTGLREVAILSTCNRTELYCALDRRNSADLVRRLCAFHDLPPGLLEPALYHHWNREAVRHLMRVASGLDSMILGEPQIFGQVKNAFNIAREQGTLGAELRQLADCSYAVAKQVRTDTAIGEQSTSVAYIAVRLAERIFADLGESRALLIGAGETIRLVGRHLRSAGLDQFTIANRSAENAGKLARELNGQAASLNDLHRQLRKADIVISSTGSQLPILGKGAIERALQERRQVPMLLVDLAVPRDIEPEVASLENAYLYSIDDLQQLVAGNLSQRAEAAREAERIIARQLDDFTRSRKALAVTDTLVAVRNRFEQTKTAELEKALAALKRGEAAEEVLERLARQLTNKLLHTPTLQLKQAGGDGDLQFIEQVRRLFQLPPDD